MRDDSAVWVRGEQGLIGALLDAPPFDERRGTVRVRLEDGRIVDLPTAGLRHEPDGTYYLDNSTMRDYWRDEPVMPRSEREVINETPRTEPWQASRAVSHPSAWDEVLGMPLLREQVDVRRVAVDRDIDAMPEIRYEGDTTIIPIVEEVLVVHKQLRLKEEVHITKNRMQHHYQDRLPETGDEIRREEVQEARDIRNTEDELVRETSPRAVPVTDDPLAAIPDPTVTRPAASLPIRRNRIIKED